MIAWIFVIVIAAVVAMAIAIYRKRAAAQRIAHEARMRAMAQTYLAAARKKKLAEAAGTPAPAAGAAEVVAGSSSPRDERECPFCAETILKKARVCKHCRRDVEPVA